MPDDIRIELPATAVKAIGILEDAGYEAWCVGGYVRDALMGIDGGDVDIATSARSEQTMMLFEEAGYRTLDTGIAYGTVRRSWTARRSRSPRIGPMEATATRAIPMR